MKTILEDIKALLSEQNKQIADLNNAIYKLATAKPAVGDANNITRRSDGRKGNGSEKSPLQDERCELVRRNSDQTFSSRLTKPDLDGVQWLTYRARGSIRGFKQQFFTVAFLSTDERAENFNEGVVLYIKNAEASQFQTETMKYPELYVRVFEYEVESDPSKTNYGEKIPEENDIPF